MQKVKNYIHGQLIELTNNNYFKNTEPASGIKYSLVPNSGKEDIERAYQAAKEAYEIWSANSVEERALVLENLAYLIEQNLDELARAEAKDTGRPIQYIREKALPMAAYYFRQYAAIILQHQPVMTDVAPKSMHYTLQVPLGIVGFIFSGNLLLRDLVSKIAPALAAGNAIMANPSENSPMTAYLFSELCQEAAMPKGLINFVYGHDLKIGRMIVQHEDVPAISYVGDEETGKKIASVACPSLKKFITDTFQLHAFLVQGRYEKEKAMDAVIETAFLEGGPAWASGTILFVQQDDVEEFNQFLKEKLKLLKIGNPMDKSTDIGPVSSSENKKDILANLSKMKEEGAEIVCGGDEIALTDKLKDGFYIMPSVVQYPLEKLPSFSLLKGPMLTIVPYGKRENILHLAHKLPFLKRLSIWTNDFVDGHKMAHHFSTEEARINSTTDEELENQSSKHIHRFLHPEIGINNMRFFTNEKRFMLRM